MNLAERQAEMRKKWSKPKVRTASVQRPPFPGGYAKKLISFLRAQHHDRQPYESADRRLITHMCHFCLMGNHESCANPDCPCPCGDTEFLYQGET